jgi:hypothetical protein
MAVASEVPEPQTCLQIMQDAYFDAGLIGEGDSLNSEQQASARRRLNKLVNYLQTKGMKLFAQTDYALSAPILQVGVGGQGNPYTFGPGGKINMAKPRRITEAYYVDGVSQTRRPIIEISRNEWNSLSTTTNQGTITSFYVDKQLLTLDLYLWLVPDALAASGVLHVILDQQIGNFAMVTDTMAFPPEWSLALEWGLANQLATGQPDSVVQRCAGMAAFYQSELEDWDVEDADTSFQPDPLGLFAGRRFL